MTQNYFNTQSPLNSEANLFLNDYAVRYSAHSVRVKHVALKQLILFLEQHAIQSWHKCDDRVLRDYVISRAKGGLQKDQQKLSSASIETQLASIRIFFQFLLEKEQIPLNYARLVTPPKKQKRLPKVIEAELLGTILDRIPENEFEVRDLAILELVYSSGLRLAEVTDLNVSHINFEEGLVLIVDGKGGKDRLIPIGEKAIAAINQWLSIRQDWSVESSGADLFDKDFSQEANRQSGALFISKRGERLTDRQISRRIKAYAEKSGVNINLHPHLLRHSMATHMLESSQDIRLVQELLGHADISTTQVYTHLNYNHLAKVFDAAHPRAKNTKASAKVGAKKPVKNGETDKE